MHRIPVIQETTAEREPIMTWHTEIVASDLLQAVLRTIRQAGGIITGSCPCPPATASLT